MDKQKKTAPRVSARALRSGAYAGALCAIALAAVVAVNLFAGALPSKYTTVDMTDQKLYTLSDETRQVADALSTDVTMYYLAASDTEDVVVGRLLDQYDALPRVTVVRKDPVAYPAFAAAYDAANASVGSVIVDGGSRYKVVDANDLYLTTMNYETYTSDTTFQGESALTSALSYVASDVLPKLYTITGHGEAELSSTMSAGLSAQNMELATLNLLTEAAVPADADAVLLNAPVRDLSEDEAAKLSDYLAAGGGLYLTTGFGIDFDALPNLTAVLAEWGLAGDNALVVEGDSNYCLSGYLYYLLPAIGGHAITDPLVDAGSSLLMPYAHAIRTADALPEGVTVSPLLTTSDSAYLKAGLSEGDSVEKKDGDETGAFDVAVAAENSATGAQLVWFSSAMFADDDVDSVVSGSNGDLALNAVTWLTDAPTGITVHTKSLASTYVTVPAASRTFWSLWLTICVPVVLLIVGFAIWLLRRKK